MNQSFTFCKHFIIIALTAYIINCVMHIIKHFSDKYLEIFSNNNIFMILNSFSNVSIYLQ